MTKRPNQTERHQAQHARNVEIAIGRAQTILLKLQEEARRTHIDLGDVNTTAKVAVDLQALVDFLQA